MHPFLRSDYTPTDSDLLYSYSILLLLRRSFVLTNPFGSSPEPLKSCFSEAFCAPCTDEIYRVLVTFYAPKTALALFYCFEGIESPAITGVLQYAMLDHD